MEKKIPFDGTGRQKCIPPETIVLSQWYAWTVNLPDNKNVDYNILIKYNEYVVELSKYSRIKGLEYTMYPEQSSYGRLHFHGKIQFNNTESIVKFYDLINSILYAFEVDTISDMEKWDFYIKKGQWIYEDFFKSHHRNYNVTSSNNKYVDGKSVKSYKVKQVEDYIDNVSDDE